MTMTTNKPRWQKPTITAHGGGAINKFGQAPTREYMESLDGVDLNQLMDKYGSPLFVISEKRIRENVRRLRRAFETRYPKVIYGWSYKTNYLSAVCNVMHQEGAWAEVVSDFEYEKARMHGIPGNRILFNGPHKERAILERCVEEGAHLHLDHLDELYLLESICEEKQTPMNVTMRLNFDTGYAEPWSRFGFNIESGQAMDAAVRIGASSWLNLTGLHCHVGTFITDPRAYASQIHIMCGFMDQIELNTQCVIETIDVGGGFPSKNSLHGVYLPPEQIVPEVEVYAEVITNALMDATAAREQRGVDRPTLILESGRSIIDDAEILLTSVVGTKRLPDGRRSAVIDAGVNLLFTAFWYNHPVKLLQAMEGIPEDTVLYGPLCMNIDVMRSSIHLPPLQVGDRMAFLPAGAYNNTQWMQFIEYRPNIVMIHPDGEVSVVRKAEDLAVMVAQEQIPEHLQDPFAGK